MVEGGIVATGSPVGSVLPGKVINREMVPSVHFMGCVIPNEADDILVSLAYHLLLKLSYWLLRVYLKGVTSNENCDFREAS